MSAHDCAEAIGMRNAKGYTYREVRVGPGARYNLAQHVVAYERATGVAVDRGMVVMHTCDNPPCVNPSHLRLGTVADNNQDMREKGRSMWAGLCKRGHDLAVTGVSCNKGKGRRCGVCWNEVRRAS